MALVQTRYCDRCGNAIHGRSIEVRIVVAIDEPDGRHRETCQRAETCSPAHALMAAHAAIEGAMDLVPGVAA